MRRKLTPLALCVVGACAVTILAGCRGRGFLSPPGSMSQQQANAIVHDPYPEADIAPSDPSARPLGYQQPLPEPVRNRIVPDSMPWLGR